MSSVVEDIDFIHEAISRFYKDDYTDPTTSLESVFKDLLERKHGVNLRITLEISTISKAMASEGLRTRSRVKFSLSANSTKASGVILHRVNTVRVISEQDIKTLMTLNWSQKQTSVKSGYLIDAYFAFQYKVRIKE